KQLKAKSDDTQARFEKARALFFLGDNAKAAAEFSALIAKSPKVEESANWYDFRALANARLGKAKEAREDLAKFLEISPDAAEKAYVEVVVNACLGEDDGALKKLDATLAAHPNQSDFLYNAAIAYVVSSSAVAAKDKDKAARYADRALGLLEEAI